MCILLRLRKVDFQKELTLYGASVELLAKTVQNKTSSLKSVEYFLLLHTNLRL